MITLSKDELLMVAKLRGLVTSDIKLLDIDHKKVHKATVNALKRSPAIMYRDQRRFNPENLYCPILIEQNISGIAAGNRTVHQELIALTILAAQRDCSYIRLLY
jgi:hypothetical protein